MYNSKLTHAGYCDTVIKSKPLTSSSNKTTNRPVSHKQRFTQAIVNSERGHGCNSTMADTTTKIHAQSSTSALTHASQDVLEGSVILATLDNIGSSTCMTAVHAVPRPTAHSGRCSTTLSCAAIPDKHTHDALPSTTIHAESITSIDAAKRATRANTACKQHQFLSITSQKRTREHVNHAGHSRTLQDQRLFRLHKNDSHEVALDIHHHNQCLLETRKRAAIRNGDYNTVSSLRKAEGNEIRRHRAHIRRVRARSHPQDKQSKAFATSPTTMDNVPVPPVAPKSSVVTIKYSIPQKSDSIQAHIKDQRAE